MEMVEKSHQERRLSSDQKPDLFLFVPFASPSNCAKWDFPFRSAPLSISAFQLLAVAADVFFIHHDLCWLVRIKSGQTLSIGRQICEVEHNARIKQFLLFPQLCDITRTSFKSGEDEKNKAEWCLTCVSLKLFSSAANWGLTAREKFQSEASIWIKWKAIWWREWERLSSRNWKKQRSSH